MVRSIIVLPAEDIHALTVQAVRKSSINWKLGFEIEELYDWIVAEAIRRVANVRIRSHHDYNQAIRIQNHAGHDIYHCVYDEVGSIFEQLIHQLFERNQIFFSPGQTVKLLVTHFEIIIVR